VAVREVGEVGSGPVAAWGDSPVVVGRLRPSSASRGRSQVSRLTTTAGSLPVSTSHGKLTLSPMGTTGA
jgi:hypothetical protein